MRSRTHRQFGEFFTAISSNIYKYCLALNFEPTWQQKQLLDAVQGAVYGTSSPRIAVKSGQGPGKTTACAVAGSWLTLIDPFSKLVLTAPTMRQCKEVWLAELKRLMRSADPALQRLFSFTGTGYGLCGYPKDEWGCLLITATTSEAAQGQHRKDMHIIFEEASGIPRPLVEQYKGTLSNPNAVFIQIGNPNTRDCAFFDCFNSLRHRWACYTWNAEDTPESEWFSKSRNEEIAEEFGIESDVYRVRVKGEFPFADPNCVMSSEDVDACMDKRLLIPCSKILRPNGKHAKQIGMDFARFGGDENTVFRRSGYSVVEWAFYPRKDPNDVVDAGFSMQAKAGWRDQDTVYVADAGGMGQGVMRNFHDAGKNLVEFHFNHKSSDFSYENRITDAWFHMAKLVKKRGCYLPRDNRLLQQLSGRQYYTTKKGKIVLESKDDYMDRGFDSPDRADGAVLSMYDRVEGQGVVSHRVVTNKRVGAV